MSISKVKGDTVLRIREFMTPMPFTMDRDSPLQTALETMATHQVRHLPVESMGKLVGILIESHAQRVLQSNPKSQLTVGEALIPDPYSVSPEAGLADVVLHMASAKIDYAIVQRKEQVIGIFTATDALRVLAEVLRFQPNLAA